jgi:hypothetical protein
MSAPITKQLDFLEAARAEERRLLAELEATPAYKRLKAVRATLDAYTGEFAVTSGSMTIAVAPSLEGDKGDDRDLATPNPERQPQSKRAIWLTGATNYLREKGARATSGELVAVLTSRGIDLGGKNAAWKLSSILSGSPLFDNVRGEGYGLTEWPKRAARPGTSAAVPGKAVDHASTSRLSDA